MSPSNLIRTQCSPGFSQSCWTGNLSQTVFQQKNQTILPSFGEQDHKDFITDCIILGLVLLLILAFCALNWWPNSMRASPAGDADLERLPLVGGRRNARNEKTPAATYIYRYGYGIRL